MNKITEIVAEHLKDSEFTDWQNRPYLPEEQDFIKKYRDLTEDDNLASLIAEAYESEVDWDYVRETWCDYNRC